jgi:hypothetical protein
MKRIFQEFGRLTMKTDFIKMMEILLLKVYLLKIQKKFRTHRYYLQIIQKYGIK